MSTDTIAPAVIGTAHRVTMRDARAHFAAGGTVLVSEYGHESECPVTSSTTTHTAATIGWDDLAGMVAMWRSRYPNQRFYVVRWPACVYPPVQVPADTVRAGDILPVCVRRGVVAGVSRADGRTIIRFEPDTLNRFTGDPLHEVTFYPGDMVHVSRPAAGR